MLHLGYLTCFIAFGFSAGEKGPILGLIAVLIILNLIRNENVKVKNILVYSVFIFTALFLVYFFIAGVNLNRIIHALFSRVFTGELVPAYFSLDLFHTEHVL